MDAPDSQHRLFGLHDPQRIVISMTGADARGILQDIVTNNLSKLEEDGVVYAALLTPQGKYLFDFFVLPGEGDEILIDVVRDRASALAQRIGMYCLRRQAKIAGVAPLHVALFWGGEAPPVATGTARLVADPRAPALGWRVYAEDLPAVLDTAGATMVEPTAYRQIRIDEGVPETGVELIPEDTYILEAGFERLNGVDFRKGCYVGQEVTARMKHKTELRKGIVPVTVTGAAEPGTPITANGKPVGTLFSVSNGRGLAHLRFDRAGAGMTAGDATVDYTP